MVSPLSASADRSLYQAAPATYDMVPSVPISIACPQWGQFSFPNMALKAG